ncbi:MAG: hypothetical protein ACO2PL_20230 [Armatimonadota bacterium]|jgi:hypothetical protein
MTDQVIMLFLNLIIYVFTLSSLSIVLFYSFLRGYQIIIRYGYKALLRSQEVVLNPIYINDESIKKIIKEALYPYFGDIDMIIHKKKNYYIIVLLNLFPIYLGNNVYYLKMSDNTIIIKMCYRYEIILFSLIPLSLSFLVNNLIMILIILLSLLIPFFFDPSCISFLIAHKLRQDVPVSMARPNQQDKDSDL